MTDRQTGTQTDRNGLSSTAVCMASHADTCKNYSADDFEVVRPARAT